MSVCHSVKPYADSEMKSASHEATCARVPNGCSDHKTANGCGDTLQDRADP